MRASTCDTVSRLCVRPECCWFAFPLVPALGSTGSAADRSALFASFAATTAGSDFPRSFIIGYRFSLPDADQKRDCPGQTRDLPSSDAILLRVICSSTPAGGHGLAQRPCPCCVRLSARSPLLRRTHYGAQSHTPRNRCVRFVAGVAVGSRNTRFQAACWALPGSDLHRLIAPALLGAFAAWGHELPLRLRQRQRHDRCASDSG